MKKKKSEETPETDSGHVKGQTQEEETVQENLNIPMDSTEELSDLLSQNSQMENTIKELQEAGEKKSAEIKNLNDQLLRLMADFQNYKKRTENDQLNLIKYAAEPFILNILPVHRDLERSLEHINEKASLESVVEGLRMVMNKFSKVLEEQGIKKIESKGNAFDFNLHEALMQQYVPGVEPHIVLEEVEPGYIYKDKVIKHAKVIVSQEASGE